VGAEVVVERGDETGRQVVLGRPHRDPRGERGQGLVADVVVDDVRRLPQARDVDAGVAPEPVQRLDERLARDPVEGEPERVDGGGDDVGAHPRRDERVRERGAARRLHVEPHGKPARLGEPLDELLCDVRQERPGRVVQQHAGGAEVAEAPRLLDERVGLAGAPGAVDEPDVQLAAGADDRLACLAQVRDVVERVVEAEDVDPVLGRARDEALDDVGRDGLRADEEAPAERDAERRRRARVDRADPLPGALDPSADRRVEHTAAGDLEACEPRLVEDLGDPQDLPGRDPARERLLREQANGRVDELWHEAGLYRGPPVPDFASRRRHLAWRPGAALADAGRRG
jgi:hypothetical protein